MFWKTAGFFLRKTVLVMLAIILMFAVVLVTINSRDEPLTPEAVQLLAAPKISCPPRHNLYYAFAGIDAPRGRSVTAFGAKMIRSYGILARAQASFHMSRPQTPGALSFKGKLPFKKHAPIWSAVDGHAARIRRLLAANRILYHRYRQLHRAHEYLDTGSPALGGTPFSFRPFERLHRLFLAHFALGMKSGDPRLQAGALAAMRDDIQTWRTVLTGHGGLVSKFVAVANLQQDLLALGDMLADPRVRVAPYKNTIGHLVKPFPLRDWKIGSAFQYSFRSFAWICLHRVQADPPWRPHMPIWRAVLRRIEMQFYQPHATVNLFANETGKIIRRIDGPPANLPELYERTPDPATCLNHIALNCLYDPVGKILVAFATFRNYPKYALVASSGAALQRMVELAYKIRTDHIGAKEIPRFMKEHPAWSSDPVSGKKFVFNRALERLSLKFPDTREGLHAPVWHAAP